MMPETRAIATESSVYQVKGHFKTVHPKAGQEAPNTGGKYPPESEWQEFQRMFMVQSIPLAEQLAYDWLVSLHAVLTDFEVLSIGKAEDIVHWKDI